MILKPEIKKLAVFLNNKHSLNSKTFRQLL